MATKGIDILIELPSSFSLEDAEKIKANLIDFFKNTVDIANYVRYYPDFMKQPNKLYHKHYKKFPNPYSME